MQDEINIEQLVTALHELKPRIDVLYFIGNLANENGEQAMPGLCRILIDTILAFEKCYRLIPGAELNYSQRCYEASFEALCDHLKEKPEVIHAWSDYSPTGRYLHAFVETSKGVYDYTIDKKLHDKQKYYRDHGIGKIEARYFAARFLILCARTQSYGPFEPYLCAG